MIATNAQNKLPGSVLWYFLIGRGLVGIVLIIIGMFFVTGGNIQGTCGSGASASPCSVSGLLPGAVLIVIGLALPLWSILWYMTFSYLVQDKNITINSGVLFRQSKTIDFSKIQNVDNSRGPLQMLFGLTAVNIWTSSQDQLQTSTSIVGGVARTHTTAKPDGKLYLAQQDADDLKNYMTK